MGSGAENRVAPKKSNKLQLPGPDGRAYLSVQVHAWGKPLPSEPVTFCTVTSDGEADAAIGNLRFTDLQGRVFLPDPVEAGVFGLVVQGELMLVGTVPSLDSFVVVGIPAKGPDLLVLGSPQETVPYFQQVQSADEGRGPGEEFEVVFDDNVRFCPTAKERFEFPPDWPKPVWWDKVRRLVVLEAREGTWLSKVTRYYQGDLFAAYSEEAIGLLSEPMAEYLTRRVCSDIAKYEPDFPNHYQRGQVPDGYDENEFDPDVIYPGQRFLLILPVKGTTVDFDEPTEVTVKRGPDFSDGLWAGIGVPWSGDLFVVGAHNMESCLFNVSDEWGGARYAWVEISGYKFGVGLGGSFETSLVIAHGYPNAQDMHQTPQGGWDFDIALVEKLSTVLKGVKGVGKVIDTMEEWKKVSYAAQQVVKNAGIHQSGIYAVPIPAAGLGLHLWGGFKFGEARVISTSRQKPSDGGEPPK